MNCRSIVAASSGDRALPLLRAALIAAGLIAQTAAHAQVQKAGELFVDIDATQLAEGALPSIKNNGTLGGFFVAAGGEASTPDVTTVGGTKGITFGGADYLQLFDAVGGALIPPPVGLVGEDPTRSIEVWVLNPEVAGEETLVAWGKRGGPDGTNLSFGYGSDFRWGAMGHWGGDGPDLGWDNNGGNPPPNHWHHLAYTFDGATHTSRVYADGKLANFEILNAGVINTHPDTSILLGSQLESDGVTVTPGLRLTATVGRVRIHDGVLTPAQILANYELEKSAFIDPVQPPPVVAVPERLAKPPVHRYSFSETAGAAASGAQFKDSIGTAHGTVLGDGASFNGSRLLLPGGTSAEAAYGDLPNGLLSQNGVANGGSGEFAFETWLKVSGGRTWSRVLDIGSSTSEDGTGEVVGPGGGGTGLDYLAYSAQIGDDVNSRRLEIRNEDPAGGGVVTADLPTQTYNTDAHVVVTWNESTGKVDVYENGVRTGGLVTDDKLSDINDVNVWLGRSNWTADQNTQGEYDEVRLYNAALSANQVLGNYQAGPGVLNVTGTDTAVAIARQPADRTTLEGVPVSFTVGTSGSTPISYQWFRGDVAISGATSATYTLASPAAADNNALFSVEVGNTVNNAPVKVRSNPAKLTVTADTVSLKHRYSFGETSGTQVKDSAGNAHGEAIGGATFGGGQLTLDGAEGSYVNLPNGIITALGDNATFDLWVTYAGGPNWSRVFDFGISTGGEDINDGGVDFLFLTAKNAQGFPRFEANFPGGGVVSGLNHPGSMLVGEQEHITITWNSTINSARMYLDGVLVASATAPVKMSAMNNQDINVWLGRSQYADAYWAGKYNEFRIYSGALSASQVAASHQSGPDALPDLNPPQNPTIAIARDGANVKITFTGTLEAADSVSGPFSAVTGATSPATISTSAAQKYYRAKQ